MTKPTHDLADEIAGAIMEAIERTGSINRDAIAGEVYKCLAAASSRSQERQDETGIREALVARIPVEKGHVWDDDEPDTTVTVYDLSSIQGPVRSQGHAAVVINRSKPKDELAQPDTTEITIRRPPDFGTTRR